MTEADAEFTSAQSEQDVREYDLYLVKQYVGQIVLYWVLITALNFATAFIADEPWSYIERAFPAAAPALAIGFLAGFCLKSYHGAMKLVVLLLQIEFGAAVVQMSVETQGLELIGSPEIVAVKTFIVAILGTLTIWRMRPYVDNTIRNVAAISVLICGALAIWQADNIRYATTAKVMEFSGFQTQPTSPADRLPKDQLWEMQARLVDEATAHLHTPEAEQRVYIVAVAADGTQEIFRREASLALDALSDRFGERTRMRVLLSNHGDDALDRPLASVANLNRVTAKIAADADPDRDMIVFYITSHGSEDASVFTALFDYSILNPVSATDLRESFDFANFGRKIVIVSSCYSGSWIPPLKDDGSLIITASRADRVSYGCSDDRELTIFGEALLNDQLRSGTSLAHAFKQAKIGVVRQEKAVFADPSEPQVYVGKNMEDVWFKPVD